MLCCWFKKYKFSTCFIVNFCGSGCNQILLLRYVLINLILIDSKHSIKVMLISTDQLNLHFENVLNVLSVQKE